MTEKKKCRPLKVLWLQLGLHPLVAELVAMDHHVGEAYGAGHITIPEAKRLQRAIASRDELSLREQMREQMGETYDD